MLADDAAPRDESAGGLWAPDRRRLTIGLVLTITLVAFEALAISTVMPVVRRDLGGLDLYGWVFSGFFLGNLVGIVIAGDAADEKGTRPPFAAGLLLFAGGLLAGGLAQSMLLLVVARVAQGIGAGAIPAIAYTTVGREYPAALRARVFAVFSTAWVVPSLAGPALSSALADATSWRWVFLALLPLVALAAAITLPQLHNWRTSVTENDIQVRQNEGGGGRARDRRPAALLLTAGVGLALAAGSVDGVAPRIALFAIGLPAAAMAFLRLVPPGTARFERGMPAAIAARGVLTFAFFGTDAYVSLAFTDGRDKATWVGGVALTAASLLWTTGAWIQQRLILTWGPRALVRLGFAFVAVGICGMLLAVGSTPVPVAIAVWSLAGLGMGLSYAPISVTVLGAAPAGQEGAASASMQLTDVLGVSLGTGVAGAVVALGDGRGWDVTSALSFAFAITLVVALAGALAAARMPERVDLAPVSSAGAG